MTHKLVEGEDVAFIYGSIGQGALAVRGYLNDLRVPQIFILIALEQINDPQHYPWTMGFLPTLYREGLIQMRYILAHKPDAKIAILSSMIIAPFNRRRACPAAPSLPS
jgi:branched-chain amino acid transport system substrate-binding protein